MLTAWLAVGAIAAPGYEILAINADGNEAALRVLTHGNENSEAPVADDHCPYGLGVRAVGSEYRVYGRDGLVETIVIHDPPIEGQPCTSPEQVAARTAEAVRRLAARGLDVSHPPPTQKNLPAGLSVAELESEEVDVLSVGEVEITRWDSRVSASVYTTQCYLGSVAVVGDIAVVTRPCSSQPGDFGDEGEVYAYVINLRHPVPMPDPDPPRLGVKTVTVQAMDLDRGVLAFKIVGQVERERGASPRRCAYPGVEDPLAGVVLGHMDLRSLRVTQTWTVYRAAADEERCTNPATATATLAEAKARSLALGLDRSHPPTCVVASASPQQVTWGGREHTVTMPETWDLEIDGKKVAHSYNDKGVVVCSDGRRGVVISAQNVTPIRVFDLP